MAKGKVRCVHCGAQNTDLLAERCRICKGLLPDAARRRVDRLGEVTAGPAFNVIVEQEVVSWQEITKRGAEGARSRRPTEGQTNGRFRWRRKRAEPPSAAGDEHPRPPREIGEHLDG
jgi:hypothetical protein